MFLLRSENGCPWDREQTHKSIRNNLIEETYEAIEAIDNNDISLMKEELGDVLLQVVFHCRIAQDSNEFDINDVTDGLCKKLIKRHPHVFGDIIAADSGTVLKNWDDIKTKTKKFNSFAESMNGISPALPALIRAGKIGEKGAKAGFDFESALDSLEKAKEEITEVEQALRNGGEVSVAEEIGDLLLAVVSVARLSGINAEEALYNANEKFISRFETVEKKALENGIDLNKTDKKTKIGLWENAKAVKIEKNS